MLKKISIQDSHLFMKNTNNDESIFQFTPNNLNSKVTELNGKSNRTLLYFI